MTLIRRIDPPTIDGEWVDLTARPASPSLGYAALAVMLILVVPPLGLVVWHQPALLAFYVPAAFAIRLLAQDYNKEHAP